MILGIAAHGIAAFVERIEPRIGIPRLVEVDAVVAAEGATMVLEKAVGHAPS